MRPRLAFTLLAFLALLALAVSLLDGEGSAGDVYDLRAAELPDEMSFPADAATASDPAAVAPRSRLLDDDPWPRQELVTARRERREALEEVARAIDRARQREAAGGPPAAE